MTQSRPAALHDLEREVGVLMRRVKRVIAERATEVHPELQATSYLMLTWVAEQDPVRASALACEFKVDKGAVSRTVQHLEDLGLLERKPDPADGRATLVSASAEARRRLDSVEERRREWFNDRLQGWTVAELGELSTALHRYNDALD